MLERSATLPGSRAASSSPGMKDARQVPGAPSPLLRKGQTPEWHQERRLRVEVSPAHSHFTIFEKPAVHLSPGPCSSLEAPQPRLRAQTGPEGRGHGWGLGAVLGSDLTHLPGRSSLFAWALAHMPPTGPSRGWMDCSLSPARAGLEGHAPPHGQAQDDLRSDLLFTHLPCPQSKSRHVHCLRRRHHFYMS